MNFTNYFSNFKEYFQNMIYPQFSIFYPIFQNIFFQGNSTKIFSNNIICPIFTKKIHKFNNIIHKSLFPPFRFFQKFLQNTFFFPKTFFQPFKIFLILFRKNLFAISHNNFRRITFFNNYFFPLSIFTHINIGKITFSYII